MVPSQSTCMTGKRGRGKGRCRSGQRSARANGSSHHCYYSKFQSLTASSVLHKSQSHHVENFGSGGKALELKDGKISTILRMREPRAAPDDGTIDPSRILLPNHIILPLAAEVYWNWPYVGRYGTSLAKQFALLDLWY